MTETRPKANPCPPRGFALVVCLVLLVMVTLLVVGLLSLSLLESRRSGNDLARERARANARLGLSLALGQLQMELGPDQRVSAPASILAAPDSTPLPNPHWTGVWSTHRPDGSPVFERDDEDGGLRDERAEAGYKRESSVRSWLVSGANPIPSTPATDAITLVGPGTVGQDASGIVTAGKIPVGAPSATNGRRGHAAWWVGDEGIKANVAIPDAHAGKRPVPDQAAKGGYHALLANQSADTTPFTAGAKNLDTATRRKLLTSGTNALVNSWLPGTYHHTSVVSMGVLANGMDGRLKRDLSAWLDGPDAVPALGPSAPGLSTTDNMVGPANPGQALASGQDWSRNRHAVSSPKFGVLKSWAKSAVKFDGQDVPAILPKTTVIDESTIPTEAALSNFQPVDVGSADRHNLLPILVEGSNYFGVSWYRSVSQPGLPQPTGPYQVRFHLYPRVVLWNPYNVELTVDKSIVMIQGNGRQEMWTDGYMMFGNFKFGVKAQWIWFEGGRSTNFSPLGGSILNSMGYEDPHIGGFVFSLPKTTFAPGECLVFTASQSAEYSQPIYRGSQVYALEKNTLSCEVAPDPSLNYQISHGDTGGGINFIPTAFWFAPTNHWRSGGIANQGDDCRVVWKHLGDKTDITFEEFDRLPQLGIISASLQYGAGKEPRVSWDKMNKVPIEETASLPPVAATLAPDTRTREGVRLRWHREHLSNELASGPLKNTAHFEEAALANWNPRAAFAFRSPWDNVAGNLPKTGTAGGPWFFGIYTRDMYDEEVSWYSQTPISCGGRQHGNPFGPPQEGLERRIVFDVPRQETGVLSIGQFMHAKTSDFVWHPSMAIGQSLADPRLSPEKSKGLDRTAPKPVDSAEAASGGFSPEAIGWSSDRQRGGSRDSWRDQAALVLQDLPDQSNLVYDLSFELNQTLWDDFFLSTGNLAAFTRWWQDPLGAPLPNGRMRLSPWTPPAKPENLADLHRAAYHLLVDGAFNVNSTSVEAWKAVLGSSRHLGFGPPGAAVFPRLLRPVAGPWATTANQDPEDLWSGFRALDEAELDRLAREIVRQVNLRGPFLSLADFVNRRLANDETGRMGALQAAIEAAGLNDAVAAAHPLDNSQSLPDFTHPDNIRDATRLEQTHKPNTTAWGAPGHLTQGDILQSLGPMLTARSDTFVIRTYGDTVDANGKVLARAWCEAVVQRTPEPMAPDATGLNPAQSGQPGDPGRRFVIREFRWLDADDV